MTPAQLAARENSAVRRAWGEPPDSSRFAQKNVAEAVRPYLGSGLPRNEVARLIGCTPTSVSNALKKLGGSL